MHTAIEQYLTTLRAENRSEHTIRAYQAELLRFATFCGPIKITDLCHRVVREYQRHVNQTGLAMASRRRRLAAATSFLRWLYVEGLIEYEVSIKKTRAHRDELPSIPSEDQLRSLLDGPIPTPFPERDRLILELLYSTGIRVHELVGINMEDFRGSDEITIRGKGKKERTVLFGEYARQALDAYLPIREKALNRRRRKTNALLFGHSDRGVERLDVRNIGRMINAVAAAKALPSINPHAFRHAFATHMLDHGASIVSVSRLLGHSKLSTTERYTRVSAERMMQSYRQVAKDFGTNFDY